MTDNTFTSALPLVQLSDSPPLIVGSFQAAPLPSARVVYSLLIILLGGGGEDPLMELPLVQRSPGFKPPAADGEFPEQQKHLHSCFTTKANQR